MDEQTAQSDETDKQVEQVNGNGADKLPPEPLTDPELINQALEKIGTLKTQSPPTRENFLGIVAELIRIVDLNEANLKRVRELETACRAASKTLAAGL